jgi:hypothetical protein
MEYKGLHLRVDIANNSKAHDNRRSLFLGGLPFGECYFTAHHETLNIICFILKILVTKMFTNILPHVGP